MALQSKYYPTWREARVELNELPLRNVSTTLRHFGE